MRRLAVLLMAVFLVNLPFVNQLRIDRQITGSGKDVEAVVLDARKAGDSFLVDYRLPRSADSGQATYSARVDRASFEQAEESERLRVRVVPGSPATNRPAGAVTSHLFTVVAVLGDTLLLVIGLVAYRRWRSRSGHVVTSVAGREVSLESPYGPVTVLGPGGWADRLQPGQRVRGRIHLATEDEVVPGETGYALEQVSGASYVVRGRVVDTRAGQVVLEVGDPTTLLVETGGRRIRADIRDHTEVRGTLCFTPGRMGGAGLD